MEKNALTEEQQAFLEENFRTMKEKELFEKLSELGPRVTEPAFMDALRAVSSKAEEEVFRREVSEEELAASTGGNKCGVNGADDACSTSSKTCGQSSIYYDNHCTGYWIRFIYEGSFPNCAATVEDGSWCGKNDACYGGQVNYKDMKECHKAWR